MGGKGLNTKWIITSCIKCCEEKFKCSDRNYEGRLVKIGRLKESCSNPKIQMLTHSKVKEIHDSTFLCVFV